MDYVIHQVPVSDAKKLKIQRNEYLENLYLEIKDVEVVRSAGNGFIQHRSTNSVYCYVINFSL
jgi:putative NIF3 family GTP cyclohydrolase 1 type 2